MGRVHLVGLTAAVVSCSGGALAPTPPSYEPEGQTKCTLTKSQSRPLIVEWPAPDRMALELQVQKGIVAVRYVGCEMEVLRRCRVPSAYRYIPSTPQNEQVTITNEDELYATVPIGAAKLEGKLAAAGQLHVDMTLVGMYETDAPLVRKDQLEGECAQATHVVTALSVGAFEFVAGGSAEVSGGAGVPGVAAGARSAARREVLNRAGEKAACDGSSSTDHAPPFGCGALLRVEVVPLGEPQEAAKRPPPPPPGMVRVHAGTFWMGCAEDDEQSLFNDTPRREVHLDAFHIDKTEVTVDDYRKCVDAGRCKAPRVADVDLPMRCTWMHSDRGRHPIDCVDWRQAQAYCSFVGKRLPTEAEWEKAARGDDSRSYPWGNAEPEFQLCWKTHASCPVGRYPVGASPYGALDMAGNLQEWVADWYRDGYANAGTRNPTGPAKGDSRVIRGGNWLNSDPLAARTTTRDAAMPGSNSYFIGFRCAQSAK